MLDWIWGRSHKWAMQRIWQWTFVKTARIGASSIWMRLRRRTLNWRSLRTNEQTHSIKRKTARECVFDSLYITYLNQRSDREISFASRCAVGDSKYQNEHWFYYFNPVIDHATCEKVAHGGELRRSCIIEIQRQLREDPELYHISGRRSRKVNVSDSGASRQMRATKILALTFTGNEGL